MGTVNKRNGLGNEGEEGSPMVLKSSVAAGTETGARNIALQLYND